MTPAWPMRSVASLATYINGYPFKPYDHEADGLPVIRIKQLNDSEAETDFFSGRVPERNLLRNGDLVFSWSGSLCVKEWNRGPAWLNQHLFRVIPVSGVDKGWLRWALEVATVEFESHMHGSAMTHITKPMMREVRLPLPPLDVQRRIADFLDDQVQRIEHVRILRRRQRQDLDGRGAASAAEIVDTLPTVQWTRLSRFWRRIEQGGSPVGTGAEVLESEPGVVKTSCVKQGVFFSSENKALADPAEYEARYRLFPGDLLIVRGSGSGDLVADCAVVTEDVLHKQLMLSDLIYRPADLQLNPRFVCAFLLTPQGKSQIRMLVRQGSGPAKVRGEDIGSVRVPVLSGTDQSRFAAAYWGMREHASKIDQSLKQSVDLLDERKRSLITAAVTGEFDVTTASSRVSDVALSAAGGAE